MLGILGSIVDTIVALVTYLTHTITSLINLFAHLPAYTAFLISSVNVLPGIIIPFALASVTLGALLFILGR